VNTEQLRQSVREKWLNYYRDNRVWITRLATWGNYRGQRRPSSSFILASLSILEPELPNLLPMMVELSNDPDRLITALGLNFNPENELKLLVAQETATTSLEAAQVKQLLPGEAHKLSAPQRQQVLQPAQPVAVAAARSSRSAADQDSDCRGSVHRRLRE
jgi:hypothetical protein